jgi:hypothetical protein
MKPKITIEADALTGYIDIYGPASDVLPVIDPDAGLNTALVSITLAYVRSHDLAPGDYVLWSILHSTPPLQPMMMRVTDILDEYVPKEDGQTRMAGLRR